MGDEDEKAKKLAVIKMEVRAVIESKKGGVEAHRFNKEYQEITFQRGVPFKEFGCNSLEEFFVKHLTDTVKIVRQSDGETMFTAVFHEKTAKLASLVSRQKTVKKKASKGKPSKFAIRRPASQRAPWGMSPRPHKPVHMPTMPVRHKPHYMQPHAAPLLHHPQPRPLLHQLQPTHFFTQPVVQYTPVQVVPQLATSRVARQSANSIQVEITNPNVVKYGTDFEVPPRFRKQRPSDVPLAQNDEPHKKRADTNGQGVISPVEGSDEETFGGCVIDKDYKSPLQAYAQSRQLPRPVYETILVGSKGKHQGYAGTVVIRKKQYNSEGIYRSKKDAEHASARNACADLGVRLDGTISPTKATSELPVFPGDDTATIKDQVRQLVERRPNGLWKPRLKVEYRDTFKFEPPPDLLDMLPDWPDVVKIESFRHILYPVVKPAIKLTSSLTPTPRAYKIGEAVLPPSGSQLTCAISFIENPNDFYVQLTTSCISSLSDLLNSTYQSRGAPKPILHPQVGDYCVTQYDGEEETWYRAEVLSVDSNPGDKGVGSVFVYYVDYGNKGTVSGHMVHRILDNMCEAPAQAIKCSLHHVYPLAPDGSPWSDECSEKFQEMCLENELKMKVVNTTSELCEVELYLGNLHVNSDMVDKKLASDWPLPPEPSSVVLPVKNEWDVYVCLVNTTTDIIVRLVEYAESLEELERKMEEAWMSEELCPIAKLHEEQICIACIEDGGESTYSRARIVSLDVDKAKVNFLDHGGAEDLQIICLKPLPPHLNELPYQALLCKLTGLEAFEEDEKVLEQLTELAQGKTLVADVNERLDTLSVTLWDTSTDLDVNINEKVAQVLLVEELRPNLPQVRDTVEGYVSYVSDAGHAYLHIQGPGMAKLDDIMADLLKFYTEDKSAEYFVSSLLPGKLYVVKHAEDDMWYRAHVIGPHVGRKVEVLFVDYGITAIIHVSSLRELPPPSSKSFHEITSLPHQALKCGFLDLPPRGGTWTQRAVGYIRSLLPSSQVTIEVVHKPKVEEDGLPEVEIFVCTGESGDSLAVTETMLENSELFFPERSSTPSGTDADASSSRASSSLSSLMTDTEITEPSAPPDTSSNQAVTSHLPAHHVSEGLSDVDSHSIISPVMRSIETGVKSVVIDSAGDRYNSSHVSSPSQPPHPPSPPAQATAADSISTQTLASSDQKPEQVVVASGDEIYVTWVADPSNFRIIPVASMQDLQDMMNELDAYCCQQPEESRVPPAELQVGQLYAGCLDDCWYRVLLGFVIPGASMVSLHFVDYGDYNIVPVSSLLPLPAQFRQLPYQAIKASLAGLAPGPQVEEWSEQAIARFSELVLEKEMVAWIHKTNEHGFVSVTLVDCIRGGEAGSTNTFIHRILIDEQLVVKSEHS